MKKAFTLAEVLIVLAIAGIIASFGIATIQKSDKGVKYLYSNTYHSLDRALYNAIHHDSMPNPFDKYDSDDEGNTIDDEGGIIGELTDGKAAQRLCVMLTKYINTLSTSCSESGLADDTGTNLGSVKFVAYNGTKFYISKRLPEDENAEHKFFIIYADLNGDRLPNSIEYTPLNAGSEDDKNASKKKSTAKDPDIFAFAALDIGRICPLGAPEIDMKFMQTRVMINSLQNENNNNNDQKQYLATKFSSPSKPYYISKLEAWGPAAFADKDDNNSGIIDENPYTYNYYVRKNINEKSKIFNFNGTNITALYKIRHTKDDKELTEVRSKLGCLNKYNENDSNAGYQDNDDFDDTTCTIIIDKYVY